MDPRLTIWRFHHVLSIILVYITLMCIKYLFHFSNVGVNLYFSKNLKLINKNNATRLYKGNPVYLIGSSSTSSSSNKMISNPHDFTLFYWLRNCFM